MPRWLVALGLIGCSDYEVTAKPDLPDEGEEPAACDTGAAAYAVVTDASCLVVAEVGTFSPVVEWQWNANAGQPGYDDIMAAPAAANLTDDDGDGDVDADDIPDIVFTTFTGGAYTSPGALNAISGDGTGTHWSILDAGGYHFYSSGGVAIGDIDADGLPEVCAAGVEAAVVCVTNEGAFKWAAGTETYGYGAPAFADLDADGLSEVIFGRQAFDAAGNLLWTGGSGAGWWYSFAIDLDQNGRMEVVAGNTLYRADGEMVWNDGTNDGAPAVGDFDLDGIAEVVHISAGTMVVTNADGTIRWATAVPGGCTGGPPTVADFDNDGYPEVGVAGASYYSVYDTDGSVLWSQPVQDNSSCVTGSSVFDFEGDGYADVVYADEITLWVYDGATGTVKLQDDGHASGTLFEYPLILDVDNDGVTEIVLASNNYAYSGYNGITVIGDADGSWRPSRPIWNQYAYHITNVEDDGSIPAVQEPNWARWNNFRSGGSRFGASTDLADLVPGEPIVCTARCGEGVVEVLLPVENTGLADTPEFDAGLYRDGQLVRGETLATPAGTMAWLGPWELTHDDWRGGVLLMRVDSEEGVEECDEGDNSRTLGEWPCAEESR